MFSLPVQDYKWPSSIILVTRRPHLHWFPSFRSHSPAGSRLMPVKKLFTVDILQIVGLAYDDSFPTCFSRKAILGTVNSHTAKKRKTQLSFSKATLWRCNLLVMLSSSPYYKHRVLQPTAQSIHRSSRYCWYIKKKLYYCVIHHLLPRPWCLRW